MVLVIMVCALSPEVFSQSAGANKRFSFSVAPLAGVLYGQSEEIVYPQDTKAKYLSQLIWDMKPLFYTGAVVDFSILRPNAKWGFFSEVSFRAGVPGGTGKMEDRDWQSKENEALTNYSVHDNKTSQFLWIEGGAGVFIPVKKLSRLRLSLNLSYMLMSFSGSGGYYQYAANIAEGKYASLSEAPQVALPPVEVIRYTQSWLVAAPAISFDSRFLNYFSGGIFFQISPLIWCSDIDEHVLAEREFREYMYWGLFLEPKGKIAFSPNERFEVSLDLAYRYIFGTRGRTYYRLTGETEFTLGGEGGAGLSLLDAGLLFKIRF
jgi:outer membrane protease